MGRLVPLIMEEITEVIQLLGRSWRLVPQIMEEIGRRCSSCGYGRPCDHAATWGSDFEQCWLWWREGIFGAFCDIFRAPLVVPELSASRSWGALDEEEFFVIEGSGWR